MRLDPIFRVLGMVAFGLAGWELGSTLAGTDQLTVQAAQIRIPLAVVGALLGALLAPWLTIKPARAARSSLRQVPVAQLLSGTIGLGIGLLIAALLAYPLSLLPTPFGTVLPFVGVIVFGYLGVTVMAVRQKEIFSFFRFGRAKEEAADAPSAPPAPIAEAAEQPSAPLLLLDTSVIIDGRVADVAEAGFLLATLAVPRFVLNELQYIADSSEALRRNRGRRGLEMLDRLQHNPDVDIIFIDQDPSNARQVDDKLISLGKDMGAVIITNDYNLNRVARLQGVKVLNINELANAVKSVVLPGEDMPLKIIQEGKEIGQGVGYLDDGTMVVVENGRRYLNREISVQVTKVLQTNAGRLIFASPVE